ncbi:MAG TPA: PAS domain-containing sensor histidine kinase [Vicinamibacterales bacterium]|nr:PAS domain-containing sensor histidine kinase [Vicinamibacterales bacterium]
MANPGPARREFTRRLIESEERFRLLVESVRDYAIFMLDPDGFITSWNLGAERIKGYRADEIVGRHFSIFYPAADIAARKPERQLAIAREEGRAEDEAWRLRKDGSPFWANVVLTALRDDTGELRGFAKVTRDLTDRVAREEAERAAALHATTSRMKDEFLAIVSHELRTPLNVVIGQAAMLQQGGLDPHQTRRAWESLQRNLRLQAQIVEDLLDVSRIVTGKLTLQPVRCDALAILREAVEEALPSAARQGVHLSVALPPGPADVNGDSGRLRQVFGNLLANAVKFTPGGGRIDVEATVHGDRLVTRITDTGIGMSPEFARSAFDRFSQADYSVRREHGGLGLGLAIAYDLTVRHGGTMSATSPGPGQGSTFLVTLPLLHR